MKPLIRISAGLFISAALITSASANDHKILGVVAIPRNETNDLTLKLPICRVIKRIQLTADRGDVQLSGATVYFKVSHSASQSLNVPSTIKQGATTGWININSDNNNRRCVKKIAFSGHTIKEGAINLVGVSEVLGRAVLTLCKPYTITLYW